MPPAKGSSPKTVKKATKTKSPKIKKEKGPKRPTSAYLFFSQERRAEIVKANPELKADIGGVAKTIGEEWRALSADKKSKFEAMAEKDRARYESEKKKAAK